MVRFWEPLVRVSLMGARTLARLKRDGRGNVAMMFAFMAPILIGGLGMGMESAYWYYDQRNLRLVTRA
jgi:Flp pilus assembly protein TadG